MAFSSSTSTESLTPDGLQELEWSGRVWCAVAPVNDATQTGYSSSIDGSCQSIVGQLSITVRSSIPKQHLLTAVKRHLYNYLAAEEGP